MTKCKANRLREQREQAHITHEEMARRLNISKSYYWQLENKNRRLSYEMAKKIAAIFNLKPDDLFFDETNSK